MSTSRKKREAVSSVISKNPENASTQEDDENSDDERTKISGELSTMSFEDLIKLKEELGSKVYNEAVFGESSKSSKVRTDFKRANKNRPREMSTKRPVPFLGADERQKTETSELRDPRFDSNCGDYNSKVFKENYEFINDIREKEVDKLRRKMRKTTDPTEKKQLKHLILRLENQNSAEKKRKVRDQRDKEEQTDIQKARREGNTAHYKTKKERKASELVKQFLDLKQTGKLGKHLEKRRKKNAAKDRKKFSFD